MMGTYHSRNSRRSLYRKYNSNYYIIQGYQGTQDQWPRGCLHSDSGHPEQDTDEPRWHMLCTGIL